MNTKQLVSAWCTVGNRIHDCRQAISARDRISMVDRTYTRIQIRRSTQRMGIGYRAGENRHNNQILDTGQDKHRMVGWINGRRRALSRHHSLSKMSLYAPGITNHLPIGDICAHSYQSGVASASLQVDRGSHLKAPARTVTATSSKQRIQRHRVKKEISTDKYFPVITERPEQCFHCRDLQAEFEEDRAQQRALEEQVRSLEARLEDQCRITHEKYRAEMNLFLHRVHSLHKQFSNLNNRSSHVEEKITVLKFMMDKKKN